MRRRATILITMLLAVTACSGDTSDQVFADRTSTSAVAETSSTTTEVPAEASTTTVESTTTTSGVPEGAAAWTVLVYIMGDTDLEPFALEDMVELASVGSTAEVNIVSLVDRHPAYSSEGVHNLADWEDTKVVEVGLGEFTEVVESREQNLGTPTALADFVEFGITQYPAHHYALILWDHGAGWPGMGPDESNGLDILDLADLSLGLTTGLNRTWVDKLDLIGFDACLMATYEVASVVAPFADYMLASQELEPGHGWNFTSLASLAAAPEMGAMELGSALMAGYSEQARDQGTNYDITLSLLDLAELQPFQAALGDLAAAADGIELGPSLAGARRDVQGFGRNPDPQLDTHLTDFGGLLDNLGASELAGPAAAARVALDAMVVETTAGPATEGASGLSIYFPETQENFRQGYLFLEDVPHWPDLLNDYFTEGDALPSRSQALFYLTDEESYYFDDDGWLNVYGWVLDQTIPSLVDSTVYYGTVDRGTGTQTFFGEEQGDIDAEQGAVFGLFDLSYLVLDDQEDTAIAYYAWTWDEAAQLSYFDIPLLYEPPYSTERQDVLLSLVVDWDGNIVEEDFYVIDESGTYGALNADPFGLVFPLVLEVDAAGNEEWVVTTDVGLWADLPYLLYEWSTLESGTEMVATLTITDFGGNSDAVSMFPIVP